MAPAWNLQRAWYLGPVLFARQGLLEQVGPPHLMSPELEPGSPSRAYVPSGGERSWHETVGFILSQPRDLRPQTQGPQGCFLLSKGDCPPASSQPVTPPPRAASLCVFQHMRVLVLIRTPLADVGPTLLQHDFLTNFMCKDPLST